MRFTHFVPAKPARFLALLVGVAVPSVDLQDPKPAALIAEQLSCITPEYEMLPEHMVAAGWKFTIRASGNGPENRHIRSARLDGEPFTRARLAHGTITAGGPLEFTMGDKPNENWGAAPMTLPRTLFPNETPALENLM